MGVLKVLVDGTWRKVGCGDVVPPQWLMTDSGGHYAYKTITPTTGTHTVTFDAPVTLEPGIDYWLVMQNCATNAQAQGTSDPALTITGLSVTPGMFYSFSGGTFGSSDNARYPIFTLEAVTGPDAKIARPSPDDYWGPSSIAQKFQVTSAIEVSGLTAYWGGAAPAGKFGLASGIVPTGRLRLWTGTEWVREACDDDTDGPNLLTNPGAESGTTGYASDFALTDTGPARSGSASFATTPPDSDSQAQWMWTNQGTGGKMPVTTGVTYRLDFYAQTNGWDALAYAWLEWWNAAGTTLLQTTYTGTVATDGSGWTHVTHTEAPWSGSGRLRVRFIIEKAGGLQVDPGDYAYFDDLSIAEAGPERHPLKIEDPDNPGTWITVACMVPV